MREFVNVIMEYQHALNLVRSTGEVYFFDI